MSGTGEGSAQGRGADTDVLDDADDTLDDLDFEATPHEPVDRDRPAPHQVVLDIGEVLIDETRVWACWADILGVSPLTFAAVLGAAVVQGEDHRAVFAHVAPNHDWEAFTDEHERRYGGFREADLYPDARACLEELDDLQFRIGIAGNQPARRSEQLLALGLPHDVVVTSEELGAAKPDATFFQRVLDRLGAGDPAEVLYVGDRVDNDILPAIDLGLRTCWLRRGPWGRLQAMPDGVQPDLVLEGLGELPLLLREWDEA